MNGVMWKIRLNCARRTIVFLNYFQFHLMTMILTHAVRDLFLRISRKSKAKTRTARALQLKDTQHVSNNEPYFG